MAERNDRAVWEQLLAAAESALEQRERLAADSPADSAAWLAMARERDQLAVDRDDLAVAFDEAADVAEVVSSGVPDGSGDRGGADRARGAAAHDRRRADSDRRVVLDRQQALSAEVAQLQEALVTRQRIGQAVGIIMARYDLEEDPAFRVLVRLSRDTNVKLSAVASRVVADRRVTPRSEVSTYAERRCGVDERPAGSA